jgi:hypothetical protein
VVELYATLIGNYQALQTTAIVRGFSRSQLVYRNRLDYVSDLLPKPHVKSREEVAAGWAAESTLAGVRDPSRSYEVASSGFGA